MKFKRYFTFYAAVLLLLGMPLPAYAQFGGGTTIVFDPSMYARQLKQLEQ
jgi:hypothetical protein